jgi:hypothetical protein
VSQAESFPEHVDLASLVQARALLRAALARLQQGPVSDSDIELIHRAVGELSVLTNDRLWAFLQQAVQTLHQAGSGAPRASADAEAFRRLAQALLAEAITTKGPAVHEPVDPDQLGRVLEVAREQVQIFVEMAQDFAAEPAPPIDTEGRAEWIRFARLILEKAVDLVTNVAVAAAFTVSAVQMAAQHAVVAAAELTERAADQIGPMLPSLLAVTIVAAHATIGVKQLGDALLATLPRADDQNAIEPGVVAEKGVPARRPADSRQSREGQELPPGVVPPF